MRLCRWISLGAAMLGLLMFAAAPASANFKMVKLPFALKPVGEPNTLAVDHATGNVYVTDHTTNTVKVFGSEGEAPTGAPTGVTGAETPSGAFNFIGNEIPVGIAIDEARGLLYVVDVGNKVVDRFKLEGGEYKYVCQFTGFGNTGNGCLPNLASGETHPAEPLTFPLGVAVDAQGNVYVSDLSGAIFEFNAVGKDVRKTTMPAGFPAGIAVGSNGVLYVQDYQGPTYTLTLNALQEFEIKEFISEPSRAIAVDRATNEIYLDHNEHIGVYNKAGTLIKELHPDGAFQSEGVAVDTSNGNIFASNPIFHSVEVFNFVKVPDLRLAPPVTGISPNGAILHGEINPEGTSEASYHFEYGAASSFSLATSPESVEPLNAFAAATAELTGLLPNTEYSYRLSGTNSSQLTETSPEVGTFTTSIAPPQVSAVEATEVTSNSVIFRGDVNPENTPPTTYRFEYGETESYGERLPDIAIGASTNPVSVAQAVPAGLKPNTTYHYRLVSNNSAGEGPESASPDQTFKTPPAFNPPETPPVLNTGPAEAISQTNATLTGVVNPENTQTVYSFELGTSTAYGTTLFGGEAGREQGSVNVAQSVGSLQPGATYHYRLCGMNRSGTVCGGDETFTTQGFPSLIAHPSVPVWLAFAPIAPVEPSGGGGQLPRKLTRAQLLARALHSCKKLRNKDRRVACERKAHRAYGKSRR